MGEQIKQRHHNQHLKNEFNYIIQNDHTYNMIPFSRKLKTIRTKAYFLAIILGSFSGLSSPPERDRDESCSRTSFSAKSIFCSVVAPSISMVAVMAVVFATGKGADSSSLNRGNLGCLKRANKIIYRILVFYVCF